MTSNALNILKIDSSGRKAGSVSRQLSNRLVERLVNDNPGSIVVDRDAAEGLPVVTEDWIGANFTPKGDRSADQTQLLSLSDELVAELKAADVLVIGLPIYNFNMPASLKAWIDLIARVGETFHYTENGPEGLLSGKRVVVTVASGGVPVGAPMDFATPYLAHVLNFVGITDITFVSATGLAMDPEAPVKSAEAEVDALDLTWKKAA